MEGLPEGAPSGMEYREYVYWTIYYWAQGEEAKRSERQRKG
jgi:hypothetical protein